MGVVEGTNPKLNAGTHPNLLVVGTSSPKSVPCLARLRARRVEIQRLRSADQQLSGSLSTEGFQKYYMYTSVKTSRSDSPSYFLRLATPCMLSCLRAGALSEEGTFCGDHGTNGYELVAGVGAGGGPPESCAWTWRLLTADQPCGTRVAHRARREATHAGGGSQPEERHGMAAEVHMIIRHQARPVRRVF
jgi:hypothetical protein